MGILLFSIGFFTGVVLAIIACTVSVIVDRNRSKKSHKS